MKKDAEKIKQLDDEVEEEENRYQRPEKPPNPHEENKHEYLTKF